MAVSETSPLTVATTMPSTEIHPEDAELISQLARLQQMHHQIHNLRNLLPSALIGPARAAISQQNRTSPQAVAEAVAKAARQGSFDIRDFLKNWNDEKTRTLFKEANEADTPQGVDAWMVDYETLVKPGPVAAVKSEQVKDEPFDTPETARSVLEKAISNESNHLQLTAGAELGVFPVTLALNKMKFTINNDQAPRTYTIQAASTQESARLISEQLTKDGCNKSGVWTQLETLLEILAQYHDFETTRCMKCNSLVDDDLKYPFVRQAENRKGSDGASSVQWTPYHASCLAT